MAEAPCLFLFADNNDCTVAQPPVYQKSGIDIRVNLMSTEDPEPEQNQQRTDDVLPTAWSLFSLALFLSSLGLGFALLGGSNPRCAAHGNNSCLFDLLGAMLFRCPWLATHSCIHRFAPLFIHCYRTLRIKPKALLMAFEASGYFSSLIS